MINETMLKRAIQHERRIWKREEPMTDAVKGILAGLKITEVIIELCVQDQRRQGKMAA